MYAKCYCPLKPALILKEENIPFDQREAKRELPGLSPDQTHSIIVADHDCTCYDVYLVA